MVQMLLLRGILLTPQNWKSSEEFFNEDRTWDEGPLAEKAAYVLYSISDFREGDYIAKFKFVWG